MATIAFLGTGLMGVGMAGRLVGAGHHVRVYNRTPEKTAPLVDAGATAAPTPAEAVRDAEAVFAMLSDDGASREVWFGEQGVFAGTPSARAICVECSTLSHDWVMELADRIKSHGRTFIDCPVTGYPHMAADGALTLFAGAEDDDLAAARPFLEPLCAEIIHFGGVGTGTAYKLMVNLMGGVQIAAAAEGLAIAEKAGLDRETVVGALCKGAAASPQVVLNARLMAAADFETDIVFTGRLRLKDLSYALDMAAKFGHHPAFGSVAGRAFARLVEDGFGELSESKIVAVMEKTDWDQ